MRFITHQTHRWNSDPVRTEAESFDTLSEKGGSADVAYLAIPWAAILNAKQIDQVRQLPTVEARRVITVCQHIRYHQAVDAMRQLGVTHMFTPHATQTMLKGVEILPYWHYPAIWGSPTPWDERPIRFSFIGVNNHPVRAAVASLKGGRVKLRHGRWHFYDGPRGRRIAPPEKRAGAEQEYREVLSQSQYALCPRGTGPSSLRITESLVSGALPVVIADGLIQPPELESCCIRVEEKDVAKIPNMLRDLDPRRAAVLQDRGRELSHRMRNDFTFVMDPLL